MLDVLLPVMRSTSLMNFRIITKHRPSRSIRQILSCSGSINRSFHNTRILQGIDPDLHAKKGVNDDLKEKSVILFDVARSRKKQKETFLDILHTYVNEQQRRTGNVQFVYAAMRYMDEFGVNEDLDVYKAILDTMPKGRYIAKTVMQAEFFHYPQEQQCIIDFLEKMEDNAVVPDPEIETMIENIFGSHAYPMRKLRRMAYWMGKFKNLNPWPMPKPMPKEALELAKLAIKKITSVDVQRKITVFQTEDIKDSLDDTWIVSGSSPDQERLIAKHPKNVAVYVEGPYKIWVSKYAVDYFLLRADPVERPCREKDIDDVSDIEVSLWTRTKQALDSYRSIHEQDDATILGVCATGTSTKDSLLSWIRCLQARNPALESIPILFKFIHRVDKMDAIEGQKEPTEKLPDEDVGRISN